MAFLARLLARTRPRVGQGQAAVDGRVCGSLPQPGGVGGMEQVTARSCLPEKDTRNPPFQLNRVKSWPWTHFAPEGEVGGACCTCLRTSLRQCDLEPFFPFLVVQVCEMVEGHQIFLQAPRRVAADPSLEPV